MTTSKRVPGSKNTKTKNSSWKSFRTFHSISWYRKYPLPRRSRHLAKQRFSQPSKVLEGRTKTQTPQRDVACLIYGKHRDLFTSDIIRSASYLHSEEQQKKKLDTADSSFFIFAIPLDGKNSPLVVGFTAKPRHDSATGKRPVVIFFTESYMDMVDFKTTRKMPINYMLAPANISVSRIRGINRSNLSQKVATLTNPSAFTKHNCQCLQLSWLCRVFWDWKTDCPWLCPASDKWKASFCQHWCRFAPWLKSNS